MIVLDDNGSDAICYMLQQAPALNPHNRPGPCHLRPSHPLIGELDGGSPAGAAPQSTRVSHISSVSGVYQRGYVRTFCGM